MSRRTRRAIERAQQKAAEKNREQQIAVGLPNTSGYDGASFSTRRGYVYFPTLNTQREVSPMTRTEMMRRGRYLRRNTGYAIRCTKGVANMVGYLSPRAFTDDHDWNRKAMNAWENRAGRPLTFDRSGRYNVYSYQPLITESRLGDGDIATVLTSSQSGGAMVATYEGHQIGNPTDDFNDSQWVDGVRLIADRAVQYGLFDPDDYTSVTKVDAQDLILHADYLSYGHRRGVTVLRHAINNMLDITEINSDLKTGIKISNRDGYYISQELAGGNGPRGMGTAKVQPTADGDGQILTENIWQGGRMRRLNPGEQIKQLLDQRPHPNSRDFLESLNRDIAWGIGLSPDVLWNIAQLGGASVRYVLADAQKWIEAQQQLLVDQFLHRFWVYFIAKEIKAGRLPEPSDPEWFYKVGWQAPEKLTVDIGRDGKMNIDLHRAGMLTLKRWYGAQGLDEEDEIRQYVREYAMKVKIVAEVSAEMGVELDFDKVFPPAAGTPSNIIQPGDAAFSDPETVQRITDIHEWMSQQRAA